MAPAGATDHRLYCYPSVRFRVLPIRPVVHLSSPGLVESTGTPIINPHSGEEHHAQINLPNGFEYTVAHMGSGVSNTTAGIQLSFADSYGQFNVLHMNQDGVIR